MQNIKLLDCTLRDGGRVIDCQFSYEQALDITNNLVDIGVEFIELGFLDDTKIIENGFSTYFNDILKLQPLLNLSANYCVFANFGRFDFEKLPAWDETLPQFIRLGFTIDDFVENNFSLKNTIINIKNKGYDVFLQPLNTPAYDKENYLRLISFVNEIIPYSFAIVDTNGSMFPEELEFYFLIANKELNSQINIDFHSHNNLQLSFANAIWLTKQELGERILFLDCTLCGMGRGGGNLNIELVVQYLNKYYSMQYDIKTLLKLMDRVILPIKQEFSWGYSLPAFLGGVNNLHPSKLDEFYEDYVGV